MHSVGGFPEFVHYSGTEPSQVGASLGVLCLNKDSMCRILGFFVNFGSMWADLSWWKAGH